MRQPGRVVHDCHAVTAMQNADHLRPNVRRPHRDPDDTPRPQLADDVRDYIDALDPPHRRLFDRLHDLILSVVPDAEIVISYRIPLYRLGRRHVGLNAGRADGVTLTTTSPDHIEAFRRRHPQFKTNKASIQFRFDDELPDDDIKDVIRRATTA